MANSPQARKRARQANQRTLQNNAKRTAMRTAIKKVRAAIKSKDQAAANDCFKSAQSMIDRMVKRGLIATNTASRYKSRLLKAIKALSS